MDTGVLSDDRLWALSENIAAGKVDAASCRVSR